MSSIARIFIRLNHALTRRLSPWYYTRIARMKLKVMGATVGPGFWVDGKIRLSFKGGDITIGQNVRFRSRYSGNLVGMAFPVTLQLFNGTGKITIGNDCGFSAVVISSMSEVSVGNNVILGGNVRIFDHDYHSMDPFQRRSPEEDRKNVKTRPVIIEDDVFVGTSALILKGVHVGARTIIGAGSVVSIPEIPPDSLVLGNPAKIVKVKGKPI